MITRKSETLTPGEARTRKHQRHQIMFIGFAGLIGGLIGFLTGFFDQGDGNLMNGISWRSPPTLRSCSLHS